MLTRIGDAVGDLPSLFKRFLVTLAIFAVGGIAGWIGRGMLAGPPDVPTVSVYEDWRLLCPKNENKNISCEISQDVIDDKAGMRVARIVILKDKDQNTVMAITVPLQVLLEPGMGLKLGNDQVRIFQYKTCTEEGCVSVTPLNNQLEEALAGAQNAGIVVAQPDGKAVELPFSMKGYGEVRKAFLNNEAKRKSWWWRLWS
jgi:invasion protein IalB